MSDTAAATPEYVGPFRILRRYSGTSEFGCALVSDALGKRHVARWCVAESPEVARLDNEFQAQLEVAHVGVPRPVSRMRVGEREMLLSEYVAGTPLSECSPADRRAWCEGLAKLVEMIGNNNWVHGDICPKNLLVTPDGGVAIVDWELAARPGNPGAPGTLGWAPVRAWDPDFSADIETDRYCASVVAWELMHGCRAFSGDRHTIHLSQQSASLVAPGTLGPIASRLFGAKAATSRSSAVCSEAIDAQRVAWRALRAECSSAVSHASRAPADNSAPLHRAVALNLGVVDDIAGAVAVAYEWMREGVGPAVCLELLLEQAGQASEAAGELSETYRRAIDWAGELAAHARGRCAIVTTSCRTDGEIAVLSAGVRERIRESYGAGAEPVVVVAVSRADSSSQTDSRVLCATVSTALGAGHEASVGNLTDRNCGTSLGAVVSHGIRIVHGGAPTATPSAESSDAAAEPRGPVQLLARIELLLAHGLTTDAYRAAVRLTTLMLSSLDSADRDLARLVSAWRELGNIDAALHCAWAMRDKALRDGCALDVASMCDDAAKIEAVLRDTDEAARRSPVGCRAQAAAHMHRQNPKAAYRTLRMHRLGQLDLSATEAALYGLGLMSALRACGRAHSASRMQRFAEARARAGRSARTRWLAEFGRMIVRPGALSSPRASELEAMASTAEKLGLWRDARRMTVRTARALADEGQYEAAYARVRSLRCDGGGELFNGGLLSGVADRIEWVAGDALERSWALGAPVTARDAEVLALHELVIAELSGAWGRVDVGRRRPGPFVRRALRAVLRGARRECDTNRAWAGLVYATDRRRDLPSMCVAVSRAVLMGDWHSSAGRELLRAALSSDAVIASGGILGMVAVATVWGDYVDDATIERAMELRRDTACGRPSGVRRWEWHLATHAMEARAHRRPLSKSVLMEGRSMLNAMLLELPLSLRESYRRRAMKCWMFEGLQEEAPAKGDDVAGTRHGSGIASSVRNSAGIAGLDETMGACLRAAVDSTKSERGVLIFDRGDGRPRAKVLGVAGDSGADDIQVCHSVLSRAEEQGSVLVIDDAVGDPSLAERPSVKRFSARSVAVVPLAVGQRRLGYLYLETRSVKRSLRADEVSELSQAGQELATILDLAAARDECESLRRDRERLMVQADRSGELTRIGQHVSEVVHELRNVLTVVIGEAELARSTLGVDPRCAESLEVILQQAADGNETVERLLKLLRGGDVGSREVVRLYEVAEEALLASRSRRASAQRQGAGISLSLVGDRDVEVRGSAGELREVVSNLVGNAIDAMPVGGQLSVEIQGQSSGFVVLRVADTGVGMSPETVAHAFDPFFSTKGAKGNGLGLAICKSIIERHGGTVTVESQEGVGTAFNVRLPALRRTGDAASLLRALRG